MVRIVALFLVLGIVALVGFIISALHISGRENDDQQQLEYLWGLQDKSERENK